MRKSLRMIGLTLVLAACNMASPGSQNLPGPTLDDIPALTETQEIPEAVLTPISSSTAASQDTGNCPIRTGWQHYTIQPGDTLGALAEQSGVTLNALAQANCIDNPDLIAVGQVLYIPRLPLTPQQGSTDTTGGDGYIRALPNDNQCYFFTFMIGSPFVVYEGPNREINKNPLPITVPDNVYLPADARSEYRARVRLPDGQWLWVEALVGQLQGACNNITVMQTIQLPPDNRCYGRLDMHEPPPFYMDENRLEIDFIPTFQWLLVNARDSDAFHYQTYLRVVLADGRQVWIPPMTQAILWHGDCDDLPIAPFGLAG